jgi:hypothetical protein
MTNVAVLNNDTALLQKLEMKQRRISNFNPIRLFIYRLFNIDNCNAHVYHLCAFYAYKTMSNLALEKDIMQNNNQAHYLLELLSSPWKRFKDFFSSKLSYMVFNPLGDAHNIKSLVVYDASQQKSFTPQNNPSHHPLEQERMVRITSMMRPYLQRLKVNVSENEFIPLQEIKDAYRKKILCSHPDKGGNAIDFQIVKICYKQLERLINSKVVDRGLEQELSKIELDYSKEKIQDTVTAYSTMAKRYDKIVEGYDNSSRSFRAEKVKIRAEFNEFKAMCAKNLSSHTQKTTIPTQQEHQAPAHNQSTFFNSSKTENNGTEANNYSLNFQ